jgi:hypothetical protein
MNPYGPMGPMGPTGPMGPPNPYGGYPPPGMQPYGEYEFDPVQNGVISSAALWARILGVALIIVGAASLLNCNVVSFALDLVIGIYFLGGGSSLAAVVNTQGSDVTNMMQALSKLGTAFKIRVIMTIIAVVLVLLLLALVLVIVGVGLTR